MRQSLVNHILGTEAQLNDKPLVIEAKIEYRIDDTMK